MPTIGKFLFDKLLVWSKIGISKVWRLPPFLQSECGADSPQGKNNLLSQVLLSMMMSMMMLMMFDDDGDGEYEDDDHIQRCDKQEISYSIQISNEGTFKRTSRLQMGIWIWYNWYMQ